MFEGTRRLFEKLFGEGDLAKRGREIGNDLKNNPKKAPPFN